MQVRVFIIFKNFFFFRIFGSSLFFYCITNNERLPKWSHPVFSFSLTDSVICFTGFGKKIVVGFNEFIGREG